MSYVTGITDLVSLAATKGLTISIDNGNYSMISKNGEKTPLDTTNVEIAMGKILRLNK